MEETRIRVTIDLDAPGKSAGRFLTPISTDESAYGVVPAPIVVISGSAGPTVLMTGAVHGDEYEGPIVLEELARTLRPEDVAGRLIIVPYLNLPALKAGRRTSPLDGLNLNRIFPGRAGGSVSEMIAHFVASRLLPRADVLVDLHSGGRSLLYTPLAATHLVGDAERDRRSVEALHAFGAPIGLISRDIDSHGLLDYTAEAMGKMVISTELGGGGIVGMAALEVGRRGVRSLLAHLNVIAADAPPERSRLMETPEIGGFAAAPATGLYEPAIDLGGTVEAGAALGRLHSLDVDGEPPRVIRAETDGILICRRAQGIAAAGDCVAVLARDFAF